MQLGTLRHLILLAFFGLAMVGCKGCNEDSLIPIEKGPELCDGLDNDLDPNTPDGTEEAELDTPCDGDDSDLCVEGIWRCLEGRMRCDDPGTDDLELCDGEDNDCDPSTPDGSQDPLMGTPCDGEDTDLCEEGVYTCTPAGRVCSDTGGDNLEVCDGVDNDCNPGTPDGSSETIAIGISGCPTSWDRRPVIEFDPLPANTTYELYADNGSAPFGIVTLEGQNYFRPEVPIGVGGPPPGTPTTITVFVCRGQGSGRCCSDAGSTTIDLVESCTTPQPPSADNILISEYVPNGDGPCPGDDCEAGEAFEITNLSHCPVALDGFHFSYCNPGSCNTLRWMNFDATSVVPPRGVYVAMRRSAASVCEYPFLGADNPEVHGLNVSILAMESTTSLAGGWFNNGGGGLMRIAESAFVDMSGGATLAEVDPYLGSAGECESIGFNAWDACGNLTTTTVLEDVLAPNQLGRLWHPCDAVVDPVPAGCQ